MKVAFLHYHLKPGGVTSVISQQAKALGDLESSDYLILAGESRSSFRDNQLEIIPAIGYDDTCNTSEPPEKTADDIIAAIRRRWGERCDLIHIHNPLLAKNAKFLKIIKSLQQYNIPILLQVHDFAEDGRPMAYHHESYPADCHYCVINHRDYSYLKTSGLKKDGLHLLENTVSAPPEPVNNPEPGEYVLYPVRAIRRKNIGESILVSQILPIKTRPLFFTLPPNSKNDIKSLKFWQSFVSEYDLKVHFNKGLEIDYTELINSAESILTTSITEGFGFTFLEPWLSGKRVSGRFIPDICNGFESKGIKLSHMYHQLKIPSGWLDKKRLFFEFQTVATVANQAFNLLIIEDSDIEDILDHDFIDFGLLNEQLQRDVMRLLIKDEKKRKMIMELNPDLTSLFSAGEGPINHNAALIRKKYGLSTYKEKLNKIYQKVVSTKVSHSIDKFTLLNCFLKQSQFSLLKWGSFHE